MWPREVNWDQLEFGVELEFVDADPAAVQLVPGWSLDPAERQLTLTGASSGGEIRPGRLRWTQRHEIGQSLDAIRAAGGSVNWSCGLHVHVGIEPWGVAMLEPLMAAALSTQDALAELFRLPEHRRIFAPRFTAALRDAWRATPHEDALHHEGRPQRSRSGVNVAAWYEHRSVELRFPNATLDADEAYQCVELCLRWVAAVGQGRALPGEAAALAAALAVPAEGYPPPLPEPVWHRREELLNELFIPVLQPLVERYVPGAEILFVRATTEGLTAKTDSGERDNHRFWFDVSAQGIAVRRVEHLGKFTG